MPDDGGQIRALAQSGNADGQAIEAVVQVFAEQAFCHPLAQVAVGGADDSHIHRDAAVGAQRCDDPLLQGPQQPGLHGQRHVADFVEEQCAAVGHLNLAHRPFALCAGEGPLVVPEQF